MTPGPKFVEVRGPNGDKSLFRICIGRVEATKPDGSPALMSIYEEGEKIDLELADGLMPVLIPEEAMKSL